MGQSIGREAAAKDGPADLIDIALEKVVEAGLELPGCRPAQEALANAAAMTAEVRRTLEDLDEEASG
ncbi:hypothetical protein [Streptomyces tanashiensis]|uniref:hypothetical protein n=1 Tax=Streptomyces tanashiensis TaxID=67367 RepID=UPI0033EFEEA4